MPRYTASADTWRSRLADTASVARRHRLVAPVDVDARRARRIARQHQHFGGAMRSSHSTVAAALSPPQSRPRRRTAREFPEPSMARTPRGSSCASTGFEQRLAASSSASASVGAQARKLEIGVGRHVQAARTERHLGAGAQRQLAALGLGARDFHARSAGLPDPATAPRRAHPAGARAGVRARR
jgi:hypothetical protein